MGFPNLFLVENLVTFTESVRKQCESSFSSDKSIVEFGLFLAKYKDVGGNWAPASWVLGKVAGILAGRQQIGHAQDQQIKGKYQVRNQLDVQG